MNRRIALVALAILLAVTGTAAVYAYVKHADQRALAKTSATQVVIVQKQIPAGTKWSDVTKGGYANVDKVPSTAAPAGAINGLDAAIGADEVATAAIQPGQLIVRPMFGQQAAVTGALPIPKGQIAVSVSMASNAEVAGYVQPQSEVAIFVTYKLAKDAAQQATGGAAVGGADLYMTKLLLARSTVIATSAAAPSDVAPKPGASNATGNVLLTLALDQQDAQKLILAQQTGQLYMGLLSDTSVVNDDPGVINAGRVNPAPIFVK